MKEIKFIHNSKLVFFILLAIITGSCKNKSHKTSETKKIIYSEKVAKIISSATNGSIQKDETIKVLFQNDVVTKDVLEKELSEDLFHFKPEINGKVYWKDEKTLIFEPKKPLKQFVNYQGELVLNNVSKEIAEQNPENLIFQFRVKGLELIDYKGGLNLKDKDNPLKMNYKSIFSFSEKVDIDALEKSIEFKSGSKKYEFELKAEKDGRTFSFISEDLVRDTKTHQFKIKISKEKLGLYEDINQEFVLTPLEEMKVIRVAKIDNGKKPKVRIEFSDEFDEHQDLSGMIEVKPKSEIKLQKIGSSVIIDAGFTFGNSYKIIAKSGIKSKWGTPLKESETNTVKFEDITPQIEFASDGVFLPTGNEYKLQFYTSNLSRVHIEVKKVYANSLAEFLRTEKISSLKDRKQAFNNTYINRVGVIVHNETFEISDRKNEWLLNEIDLSELVSKNEKGLYLVRLNFNPRDMLTKVSKEKYKYIEENGQIYKPLFFTNIGLTCKQSGKELTVYATDLNTAQPLSDVEIELRKSYSGNSLKASGRTDKNGRCILSPRYISFYNTYISAEKNGMRSVIKFNEMEWNISGYDIGGIDESNSNTKAYIYTERGVYRPGDEINISVIARHKEKKFPDNYPITLSLNNPQGKKVYEVTNKRNIEGFYNFKLQTKEGDPTGNWSAHFEIGNKYFSHTIKIETVVPYKLKLKIEPESNKMVAGDKTLKFDILCNYLFGNPASNLNAEVKLEMSKKTMHFNKFEDFIFNNPSIDYKSIQKDIFKNKLDENGKVHIEWPLPSLKGVPSALNIKLTAKVFEKGGRPNINWTNILVEPYKYFVGLQSPKYSYTYTGNDVEVPVILVDDNGNPVPGKTLEYKIYRNTSQWWWQYDYDRNLRYKTDTYTELIKSGTITSASAHTNIKFVPIEIGNYLVEVTDKSGTGHSSGIFVKAYPYGGMAAGDKNAGTLELLSDKNKYYVGENAKISFPCPKEGNILLTIEKEDKILKEVWYKPNGSDEMEISIPIFKNMVPNAYASVSVIQPQSQTVNDRPIRTFGIIPIMVEDKETKHEIEIQTTAQFRPKEPFEVTIQTKDHKPTQFTIAVIDEGLLDITQYQTPNPWKHFFQKLRLTVQSFDLFSHVISANKGDVFKTFSIGGDMDYRESQLGPKKGKKRFKPVSFFKGPLNTDLHGKAVVKFEMPNYIGSVKIMVIGARKNSYARAEKVVPVKTELMMLPTLPRVLGPSEKFSLPVTVFAMKDNIGEVNVMVKTEGSIGVDGDVQKKINFSKEDDKDLIFNLFTKPEAGQSKVTITAKSDKFSADAVVDIMVQPKSPRIYKTFEETILKGNSSVIKIPGDGIKGTNNASLTISNFPNINFDHRLKWLMHYPYGCIEQTTSSVMPQLYLKKFIEYPDAYSERIDRYINSGLRRLRTFQQFSGAFSYWPYQEGVSEWGTLYAGHFMVEAKKLGYHVTEDLYSHWLTYTKSQARNNKGDLMYRTYRVYILALAGEASLSEMNILKERFLNKFNNTEKWLLAASYSLAGLPDKAETIISNAGFDTKNYTEFAGTYGSGLRDKAMILDALVSMQKYDKADEILSDISKDISATTWYSTQTIGYSLLAIGKYIDKLYGNKENIRIKGYVLLPNGQRREFDANKAITIDIDEGFGENCEIYADNESAGRIYTLLSWNGVPLESSVVKQAKNLSVSVEWLNEDGKTIDPSVLKQGTSFWGHFKVKNTSSLDKVEEIALVQLLPSGWEIENTRLLNTSKPEWVSSYHLDHEEYVDIRDDRIIWFFDIHKYQPIYNTLDFMVKLNTVTVGEFNLPATLVEAMYNSNYKATLPGKKVKVLMP